VFLHHSLASSLPILVQVDVAVRIVVIIVVGTGTGTPACPDPTICAHQEGQPGAADNLQDKKKSQSLKKCAKKVGRSSSHKSENHSLFE
jgi:hypothetical protein